MGLRVCVLGYVGVGVSSVGQQTTATAPVTAAARGGSDSSSTSNDRASRGKKMYATEAGRGWESIQEHQ